MRLASSASPAIREAWKLVVVYTLSEVWLNRNKAIFEGFRPTVNSVIRRIKVLVGDCSGRLNGYMRNTVSDLLILRSIHLNSRPAQHLQVIDCNWFPPRPGEILLCCDGASLGNPGKGGSGMFRDENDGCVGAMAIGLGICTNFWAEILAILSGIQYAKEKGWRKIWMTSDSQAAIYAFMSDAVLWRVQAWWRSLKPFFFSLRFSSVLREVNFTADGLERRGARLSDGEKEVFPGRPIFVQSLEVRDRLYFRFVTK
ncbi:hypothetical protein BVC80_1737g41 [Macleaya cordata]|uniref:RNase H type-1 domain-containing protein n=1 Tax=Macleaya cordata TaxID=56857 RepID=A0A200Q833_MACCD|nr:hypothetical protein BVC80_1737g41 [Macleaya cordata]